MRVIIKDAERCVGCQLCMFACARRNGKGGILDSSILIRSIGGMERGFRVNVCRACPDPPCAKVCPTNALVPRKGGGVKLDVKKCIGCGNCVDGCILHALFWNPVTEKPVVCVYCGYCTKYCPHGVIAFDKGGELEGDIT
jgi:carbon-monoxide dehydrogenase iron sulfur subunit